MNQVIESIDVFRIEVPFRDAYIVSEYGRQIGRYDSTVVKITCSSGQVGWGEAVTLGSTYLPAYAQGVRTGIQEIAPALIGADPLGTGRINDLMDECLKGHPYVKSALDMACWDLLGQSAKLPLKVLLGGESSQRVDLYKTIYRAAPQDQAKAVQDAQAEGFRIFQLKLGGQDDTDLDVERVRAVTAIARPGDKIIADVNGKWTVPQALRILRRIEDCDILIEQPCLTYEENVTVRRKTRLPFVLDESIDSPQALLRALKDDAMDAVNLKITKFGGITATKVVRDICVAARIPVSIEDSGCTDIAAAAVAHIAMSTPAQSRLCSVLGNMRLAFRTARNAPTAIDGRISFESNRPGLGVEPISEVLGKPVFSSA